MLRRRFLKLLGAGAAGILFGWQILEKGKYFDEGVKMMEKYTGGFNNVSAIEACNGYTCTAWILDNVWYYCDSKGAIWIGHDFGKTWQALECETCRH